MGCRRVGDRAELMRVVRTPTGSLEIGPTAPGRGAWLCAGSVACIDRAAKRQAFARALRGDIEPAAVDSLRARVAGRARIERLPGTPSAAGSDRKQRRD